MGQGRRGFRHPGRVAGSGFEGVRHGEQVPVTAAPADQLQAYR